MPAAATTTMRYLILAACLAACFCAPSCSAGDAVQVCCYSTSPADYPPSCYKCPSAVYQNTLLACCNVTEMPKNITFKQALCLEKNCQINYPQPEQENSNSLAMYTDLAQILSQLLAGRNPFALPQQARRKREVLNVVKRVETAVMGLGAVEFADPDYM